MNILPFLVLAAASLIPAAAPCQDVEPVRPGTALDTTFIRAGVDSVAIVVEQRGDTVRAGTWVTETRIDSANGARRIVHIQRLLVEGEAPTVADSSHFHWRTLVPISAHLRGEVPFDFLFGPPGVRIVSLRNSRSLDVELASPVFYGGAVDLLLRALPLRVGYRAVFPVLMPYGAQGEMHVSVTGQERVRTLDGGTCTSLVVRVVNGDDEGTYRIATATRDLVRYDSEFMTAVRPVGCP